MKRCLNCGSIYHVFKNCNSYITSYGIIAYKKENNGTIKYISIQRKDTISFIEFIRGNWDTLTKVKFYLSEMTHYEIVKLRTMTFYELWENMFLNKKSRVYLTMYTECKEKFESIDIISLTDYHYYNNTRYSTNEYTFPKGRKSNYLETDLDCAIREFIEETGIQKESIKINNNILPYIDIYHSVNNKEYRIIYYIAEIIAPIELKIDYTNISQYGEVKSVELLSLKEIYNKIRGYHTCKRTIIYKLDKLIKELLI